jgi:hypothetical protein
MEIQFTIPLANSKRSPGSRYVHLATFRNLARSHCVDYFHIAAPTLAPRRPELLPHQPAEARIDLRSSREQDIQDAAQREREPVVLHVSCAVPPVVQYHR